MKKTKFLLVGFLALAAFGFILQALGLAPKTKTPETPKVAVQSSTTEEKKRPRKPQKALKLPKRVVLALVLVMNFQESKLSKWLASSII